MRDVHPDTRPYRVRAKGAAQYLGLARSHFFALVAEGHLPKPQKVGRMSFWDPAELERAFDKYASTRQRADNNPPYVREDIQVDLPTGRLPRIGRRW